MSHVQYKSARRKMARAFILAVFPAFYLISIRLTLPGASVIRSGSAFSIRVSTQQESMLQTLSHAGAVSVVISHCGALVSTAIVCGAEKSRFTAAMRTAPSSPRKALKCSASSGSAAPPSIITGSCAVQSRSPVIFSRYSRNGYAIVCSQLPFSSAIIGAIIFTICAMFAMPTCGFDSRY